jgi:predicted nuclease of predicted toxin-antitoxin system
MKFKVDENLPEEIVVELCTAGHDATSVREQGLAGTDDAVIATHIQAEERGLITLDLGFGDIRAYAPSKYHGIILIRTKKQDKQTILALSRRFIPKINAESLVGKLWIVEEDRIRVRDDSE